MKKNKWFLNGGRGSGQTYRRLFEYYENKVADLEKENTELKNRLEHRNCLDCSNHSSKLRMRTLELEKENAELNNFIMQSKKDGISPINALIIKNLGNQLTKAKEHIRTLISCLIDWVQEGDKDYCYIAEAEDFLNSEVEK